MNTNNNADNNNNNNYCALCGSPHIENISFDLCGACCADLDAPARLVAIATEAGNGIYSELREAVEAQLCYSVAYFFGTHDEAESGPWADAIGGCIDGTRFELAPEQPDGSDPADLINVVVGNETWTVYLSDESKRSDDVRAYGVYAR